MNVLHFPSQSIGASLTGGMDRDVLEPWERDCAWSAHGRVGEQQAPRQDWSVVTFSTRKDGFASTNWRTSDVVVGTSRYVSMVTLFLISLPLLHAITPRTRRLAYLYTSIPPPLKLTPLPHFAWAGESRGVKLGRKFTLAGDILSLHTSTHFNRSADTTALPAPLHIDGLGWLDESQLGRGQKLDRRQ